MYDDLMGPDVFLCKKNNKIKKKAPAMQLALKNITIFFFI